MNTVWENPLKIELHLPNIDLHVDTCNAVRTPQTCNFDTGIFNSGGQSYDNVSVMSGKYSGVQARIREINDKAEYINCTNHSVTFFGTVEQVYVFFSCSTQRWEVLIATTTRV